MAVPNGIRHKLSSEVQKPQFRTGVSKNRGALNPLSVMKPLIIPETLDMITKGK